jgi:hypothetical protein
MKKIIIYVLCIFTISCASIPNFDKVRGNSGQNIAIAGMSFIPSGDIVWDIVKQHTYQTILFNKNKEETYISCFALNGENTDSDCECTSTKCSPGFK